MSVRVTLPYHLRNLAGVEGEVSLQVEGDVTVSSILDALESKFPNLRGTIRDHGTLKRRPFLRFFACGEDISNESYDLPLPQRITDGEDVFMVVGAIAGG